MDDWVDGCMGGWWVGGPVYRWADRWAGGRAGVRVGGGGLAVADRPDVRTRQLDKGMQKPAKKLHQWSGFQSQASGSQENKYIYSLEVVLP